jgi:CBS domain containing-hemolysin-like protein
VLTEWLLLGLGVLLTLGTGVFVAAEFSLITLDRPDVEREAATGSRSAASVLAGLRTLSTQLSGAQVGITLTTLLVGYLVEPSLSRLLEGPLTSAGVPDGVVAPLAVGLGMFMATVVSMLAGELVPKNLAISVPMATARWSVPLQRAFTWVMRPLIVVLNGSANRILRSAGIEPREELASGRSPTELAFLVKRSAEAGTLDEGTANLLTRSLGFSEHTAADVMTPRVRMRCLPVEASAADVIALAAETGHSRFLVTDGSLDDVVGVVHVKKAVAVPRDRRADVPVGALAPADPVFVPETVRLDPLLVDLRSQGMQLAVVTDEYGGTAGLVTLEDVVEELVGEVADEHDRDRPRVTRQRDGSFGLPGQLRPDQVRELLALQVPDDAAYETVAGFVLARLGRLARVGDEVVVDDGVLRVERLSGRRVERLRFTPVAAGVRDSVLGGGR